MLSDALRRDAAQALATAERDRVPIAPLRETYPGLDVVDAYEIALTNIRGRLAAGATVHGHKVGLSSDGDAADDGRRRARLRPPALRHGAP